MNPRGAQGTLPADIAPDSTPEAATPALPLRRRIRNRLAIDEREQLVRLAQTLPGQMLIALVATGTVSNFFPWWESLFLVGCALIAARASKLRTPLVLVATWAAAYLEIATEESGLLENLRVVIEQEALGEFPPLLPASCCLVLVFAAGWGALEFVRHNPKSYFARHPFLSLLAVLMLLTALSSTSLTHGLPRLWLWSMLVVFVPYLWFFPYAVMDQRMLPQASPLERLAVLRPFWAPSYIPFGKGAGYLRKTLFKTPDELAVSQLKAVKLLLWAYVLYGLRAALTWLFMDELGMPYVDEAVGAYLKGEAYPLIVGWGALVLSTTRYGLLVAYWAHTFVGLARLAGYRLPRGSWRPLESRTLMEYFNRFHYYFKELLVDLFFIPTFFTAFRKHPRLRMFFATFMAAGVGNAMWHFIRDFYLFSTVGVWASVEGFTSYLFYCVVLASALGLSQVRASMGVRPPESFLGRLYAFCFVWGFVVSLHVFSIESRDYTLTERLNFMASLFGASGWM